MRSIVAVLLLAACVFAIPASLIEDVKAAKLSPVRVATFLPSKVKRARGIYSYGDELNQSPFNDLNRFQREARYPQPHKRETLEKQFISPISDHRITRVPMKRSRSLTRVRSKRDSEIDPKDLLLLLALYENKLGLRSRTRPFWNNLPELNDDGWEDNAYDINQISDYNEPRNNGGWMDGPIIPNVQSDDTLSPESQWEYKDNNRKRFMVSKRSQDGDISHIVSSQIWEQPMYQRMVI